MIPAGPAIEYRRLRAPQEHGGVLIDPPLASAAEWLGSNFYWRGSLDKIDCQGQSLQQLAQSVRRDLVEMARRYTGQYSDLATWHSVNPVQPIVVTGHQPHLFHPGVWFKNFALDAVARANGAIPVNLLIDNDTLRSPTLKVPLGTPSEPRVEVIGFDRQRDEIPFEERTIADAALFASFGARVAERIETLIDRPLIHDVWPRALEAARRTRSLGQCLAQARHQLEGAWGLHTLELPLSWLCETTSFRWLAAHLLAHLPRLRDIYNSALLEYRRVNHVRSRSHPVPDLAADGQWLEAPLWVWTSDEPLRRRLFARQVGQTLELTDRERLSTKLDLNADGTADRAVEQLADWSRSGVKLRPRALITTLFARLFASDLFLHGIGGAKYDQLTDAIIRRFFGGRPPAFMTLTLTAQLPIPHAVVRRDEVRLATSWLRELRYHPERFCEDGDLHAIPPTTGDDGRGSPVDVASLVAEKRRWLATSTTKGVGAARHDALGRLNAEIAARLSARRAEILAYRDRLAVLAARHALLASREFSFCLYPEEVIRPLMCSRVTP